MRFWFFLLPAISLFGGLAPPEQPLSAPVSSLFEPDMLANSSVNVLTGDYCEHHIDICCNCLEPIPIHRWYTSWGYKHYLACQRTNWGLQTETVRVQIGEKGGPVQLSLREANGSVTSFLTDSGTGFSSHHPRQWSLRPDCSKGVTNTSRGEIGGRTNQKNWTLDWDYQTEALTLTCGDGERRIYEHCGEWENHDRVYRKRNRHIRHERFHLKRVIKPNGRRHVYHYNSDRSISHIDSTDPSEITIYGSVAFAESQPASNRYVFELQSSCGQTARYSFARHRYDTDGGIKLFAWPLETAILNGDAKTSYRWNASKKDRSACPFAVTHRLEGAQRAIGTSYWEEGKARHGEVDEKVQGNHPSRGKVFLQELPIGSNGQMVITQYYRYLYEKKSKGRSNDLHTTVVYDADHNKTIYKVGKDYRLQEIRRKPPKGKGLWPTTRQELIWGEGSDESNLIARNTYDADSDQLLLSQSFDYDERGNVLTETLAGALTTHDSHDEYTRHTTFSRDGFNLPLTESDGTTYTNNTYIYGTNLLTATTTYEGFTLLSEDRYFYDEHAILIEHIHTDGYRTFITRTTPRYTQPAFGFPDTIEELYLEDGQEKLLRRTTHSYNEHNLLIATTVSDANGQKQYALEFEYDHRRRLTKKTMPLGQMVLCSYTESDELTRVDGPRTTQTLTYDRAGRPTQETISLGDQQLSTCCSYNLLSQKTGQWDTCGRKTELNSDPEGRIIQQTLPPLLTAPGTWTHPKIHRTYNALGHLASETDPNGYTTTQTTNARGQATLIQHPDATTETYTYTLDGRLLSQTARNGTTTLYKRDARDRVLSTQTISSSGAILHTTTNTYQGDCLVATTDPSGITTHYTYDGAGRLIEESRADKRTTYTYDAAGRKSAQFEHLPDDHRATHYTYDVLDRLIAIEVRDSHDTLFSRQTYAYDADGNQTHSTLDDATTVTTYDLRGRPLTVTDPLGHTTTIAYDHTATYLGQPVLKTTTTDPLFRTTTILTDAGDRPILIEKHDPDDTLLSRTEHFYDLAGNRTSTVHSVIVNGQVNRTITNASTYGPNNRLESLTEAADSPSQRTTLYLYDAMGQLSTTVKPSGVQLARTYDPLGRLHTHSGPDFSHTYTYDNANNPIQIESHTGTTLRSYDSHNKLLSETLETGYTITRSYDALSRPLTLSTTSHQVTYSYDAAYLRSVTCQDHTHHYLTYNQRGQPLTQRLTNDALLTRTYDPLGRPLTLHTPTYSQAATYDPVGNLIRLNDTAFTYDHLDQLTSEPTQTYTYDSLGNRLDRPHNTLNQPADIPHTPDGYPNPSTHTYDSLGRLLSTPTDTYTYDPFNRILAINNEPLLYDDLLEIGTPTQPRVLGLTHCADIGATVLLLLDQPYTPVHTLRGSIARLYDDQTEQAAYFYSAFGILTTHHDSTQNPYLFCSKRANYFGQRFYDPTTGRFLTPDPARSDPNLYTYCLNNPYRYWDRYGLSAEAQGGQQRRGAVGGTLCAPTQISTAFGRAIEFAGTHLIPLPITRSATIGFGRALQGRSPFDQAMYPSSYFGVANAVPMEINAVFGHTNGVLVSSSEMLERCSRLGSDIINGPCHYLWNSSWGGASDLFECCAQHRGLALGAIGKQADALHTSYEQVGDRGGLFWTGHSQGGMVLADSLSYTDQQVRDRLYAVTFGSPRLIPSHMAAYAVNYINRNDPVGMLGYLESLQHPEWDYNIRWVESTGSVPGTEHAFMDSYLECFKNEVARFSAIMEIIAE